jgi:hypothetical protein
MYIDTYVSIYILISALCMQATMAKYHQDGQQIAGSLNAQDMDLVEQYAQTQVAAFATELEDVS